MTTCLVDRRGVPVSTSNTKSLAALEQATELTMGFYGDPLATIDAALKGDPGFIMGHCARAAMLLATTDKTLLAEVDRSVAQAESLAFRANDRELGHLAALNAWLDGDFDRVGENYQRVLDEHPRDLIALQTVHLRDFLTGQATMLRDRPARAMGAWHRDVPGYHYVLGMHAFGLEETGDYARAEEQGRAALDLDRRDPWAVHAVAHVMEMQGRAEEGIAFLEGRSADWAPDNGFAYHLWWHLALYRLDRGETGEALALYDRAIRQPASAVPMELVDAAALLWRLRLLGVDVGARWAELADIYETMAADGYYAFNDAHAMMALMADGRRLAADRLLATMRRRAVDPDSNARMLREVGLPVALAMRAFVEERYADALDTLGRVRPIAHRFGGSHAQRDLLHLTMVEAAIRAGRRDTALALLAERTPAKPESFWNRGFARRALTPEIGFAAA